MISHFVTFQHFRYLKSAVLISLGASIAYAVHDSGGHPGGGTWLGYVLGSGAIALIAWLAWFGIRKRRFKGYGLVHGWLSAHIYLGLSLMVVATLHTGFRFGWNVHTLAYALMVVVIMSGAFGAIAYSVLPSLALANRGVQSLEGIISEILSIDREVRELSVALDDKLGSLLADATEPPRFGGNLWHLLTGSVPKCPTALGLSHIEGVAASGAVTLEESAAYASLARLLGRKLRLLERARRDLRYRAIRDIWLFLHVPMTFGLIAALIAHIFSVFFFW
ncbi:MAG: hypothetical protein ACKOEC_00895 [Acidimicrobiia bacterium]